MTRPDPDLFDLRAHDEEQYRVATGSPLADSLDLGRALSAELRLMLHELRERRLHGTRPLFVSRTGYDAQDAPPDAEESRH